MDDDFGVASGLEDRPTPDEIVAQRLGVGDIAIMRDREAAAGEIGIKRLDIAQARSAGGRIAHVTCRHEAGQLGERFLRREILGDMPGPAHRIELLAVEAGDAGGFLPAMLQSMQTERSDRR